MVRPPLRPHCCPRTPPSVTFVAVTTLPPPPGRFATLTGPSAYARLKTPMARTANASRQSLMLEMENMRPPRYLDRSKLERGGRKFTRGDVRVRRRPP